MASVAPVVTRTVSGSTSRPQNRFWCSATAARSAGTPTPGGYWLTPPVTFAATSASSEAGPSVSGKPWPRLIAPVRSASADISAKIVEVNGAMRATSMVCTVTAPWCRSRREHPGRPAPCSKRYLPHARIREGPLVTTIQQTTATAAVAPTTGRERLRLVLVLGALVALGPLTIDMYLPALPAIVRDLATTDAAVQLTLTGTLVGLALGQLLVGPLSDTFGRRRPLLVGVSVHVLASLLCLVAPNVEVLGGLRLLQGIGAASASVVSMAIVRDLFVGRAAATLFSRLMLVLGVAPVVAPTIGGEILRFTSWRGVFAVLAVLALALLVMAAMALPAPLPAERRLPRGVGNTLRTYRGLLRDRSFVGLVLVAGLAMPACSATSRVARSSSRSSSV